MKDERLYEKNEAFLDVAKNAEIIVESSVELNNNNFEYYFDFEDLSEASVEVSVKNLGGNKYSIKPIGFYFPGNTYSIKIVNLDIMHFLTFDGKDVSNDNVQKYSFTIKDEEVYDVLLNEKVLTIDETDVLKIIDDVTKYEVPTKDGQDNYVSHLYIKNNYNLHKDDIIRIPGERESLVRFYKILLASPVTDTNSDYYGHLLVLAIIPEAYEYYDKYDLKISGLEEEDVISEDIVSEDELAKLIADQLYGGEGYSQMMDTLLYAVKQDETIKTLTQTLSKEEADRFNNASFRELAGTKPALSFGQLDISITKIKNDYGGYGYKVTITTPEFNIQINNLIKVTIKLEIEMDAMIRTTSTCYYVDDDTGKRRDYSLIHSWEYNSSEVRTTFNMSTDFSVVITLSENEEEGQEPSSYMNPNAFDPNIDISNQVSKIMDTIFMEEEDGVEGEKGKAKQSKATIRRVSKAIKL